MSQDAHELIHPSGPSLLAGEEEYLLNTNDLLINFTLDISYIIPARLEVSQLRDALARTLAVFPLFCGRLVKEPQWAISLQPLQPIPLIVKHELEPSWDPSAGSTNAVTRPRPGPSIEKIKPLALLSGAEPKLLKVTITTTPHATLVGISCSHTVADLYIVLKFLRTWSQHFAPSGVREPPPVYLDARTESTRLSLGLDAARREYMRARLPPLLFHTFPLDDIPVSIFAPFPIRRVDVRFTAAQVAQLHDALLRCDAGTETPPGVAGSATKLSRQDALSAFVVAALNAAYDTPVTQISNVVNVRRIPDPTAILLTVAALLTATHLMATVQGRQPHRPPEDAVGNGLLYAVTDPVDVPADGNSHDKEGDNATVLAYARAVRASIARTRDPAYVHDFLALAGQEWLAAAQNRLGHCILETPGHVIVNSSYRHDWASAHFGHPGTVCWQHPDTVPTDNYVMMFPSNPVRTPTGEWRADQGACEATFNVKAGREGTLEVAVARIWGAVARDAVAPTVIAH
ncbi:hypothetical protein C8Q80DRAFT_1274305 [Daedaleopsis nitida]|nr:hypothetical protein C8Q80DRAFT_1274305 [Daedaleopsis nitida]